MPTNPIILEPLLSSPVPAGALIGPDGSVLQPSIGAVADQYANAISLQPRQLPPGGSTQTYNNPGLIRRTNAAARLGRSVPGGARSHPNPPPRGLLGRAGGAAGGVADDVLRAGVQGGGRGAAAGTSVVGRLLGRGAGPMSRAIKVPGGNTTLVNAGRGASLARGIGSAGVGLGVSALVDQFDLGGEDSGWDKVVSGAAGGAAGGGLVGGPWAALGGGILGAATGALSLLGNQKKPDVVAEFKKAVRDQLSTVGLRGEAVEDAIKQFESAYRRADKDERELVLAEYDGYFGQVLEQRIAEGYQTNPVADLLGISTTGTGTGTSASAPTPADMIAMQAMIADIMRPYTEGMIEAGNADAAYLNQYADQVGGAEGEAYRMQARQAQAGNQRLASAYMAQAQLAPRMMALEQARQQAYQQPAASSGGGFEDLVAQLTAAG